MTAAAMLAHLMVIDTRLSALYDAIRMRDWEQVEWHADRVSRATTKAIAEARTIDLDRRTP